MKNLNEMFNRMSADQKKTVKEIYCKYRDTRFHDDLRSLMYSVYYLRANSDTYAWRDVILAGEGC